MDGLLSMLLMIVGGYALLIIAGAKLAVRGDINALRRELKAQAERLEELEARVHVRVPRRSGAAKAKPGIELRHDAAPDVEAEAVPAPAVEAPALAASASTTTVPRREVAPARVAAAAPPSAPRARPERARTGPPLPGIEELLGARLSVWLGAIALALAGAFLVKYTVDHGLLSPAVRVAIGTVFGVALLGFGEWARTSVTRIGAGLSAAGIAVLFASFYAGTSLYGLIPPVVGFALMALAAATAVGLSLRQGQIVAAVGLVGGYLTPYLVRSGLEPHPAPLFGYLLLLQLGLLVVTRRRGWWQLAGVTLAAGMLWVANWLGFRFESGDSLWLGLFILVSAGAFLGAGHVGRAAEAWGDRQVSLRMGWGAMVAALVLMVNVTSAGGYGPLEWAYMGLLGAGCLALGRLEPDYEGLGWLAAGITGLQLLNWGGSAGGAFLWTTLALGGLFAAGAYAALWGADRPSRWAALAAASAVWFFLVGYVGESSANGRLVLDGGDATAFPWGVVALALAVVAIAAAAPVLRRREALAEGNLALGALAAAATTFLSLAVPLELSRAWIAVAWSLEVAALAWIAGRLQTPILRALAWPLAALVATQLLTPSALNHPIGTWPVLNWLLYGYGVPIAAFAAAAWLSHRDGDALLSRVLQWGALALGLAFLTLQVRQLFHPGALTGRRGTDLLEWGTYGVVWCTYGLALLVAARRWPLESLERGGRFLIGLGLVEVFAFPVLADNPAWTRHAVGRLPVVNWLLYLYGLPALLALAAARELAGRPRTTRHEASLAAAASLALAFVLVTLEVRQAFRGTFLSAATMSAAENYAYSLAWIVFGIVLLVLGIARGGKLLRLASLPVMLLAVGKVFLYDTASLGDLYRVFSYLGLGLSLILLGWLYQRFVFRGEGS